MLDSVKYAGFEHRFKEKEYGIPWRSAYKKELEKEFEKLESKYGNPCQDDPKWNGD